MNSSETQNKITLSTGALKHNARLFRALLPKAAKLCAVVKADAYGHGIGFAVRALANSCDYFAVANNTEALEVASALSQNKPILVLGALSDHNLPACLERNIEPTVCNYRQLKSLLAFAKRQNTTASLHIKLNTGMNRFGTESELEFSKMLHLITHEPSLVLTGVYTHFGAGDAPESPRTEAQSDRFRSFLSLIPHTLTPIIHAANTDTLLNFPLLSFHMARIGIGLYGYCNSKNPNLRPVMGITTKIVQLNYLLQGANIGYGLNALALRNTTLAVIPIGYADGLSRALSGNGSFLCHGMRAKIIGNVCMDSCLLDVSHIKNVRVGSLVTLIGKDGSQTAATLAKYQNTISYEVLTGINKHRFAIKEIN